MTNPERYPDIEIYLQDVTFKQIEDWLDGQFSAVERGELVSKKSEARCNWTVDGSTVIAFGNAVGHFTSLWFKQNNTPWDTDLECAKAAAAALNTQVRCSNSGWSEGQRPDSKWWRISPSEDDMLIEWDH
ncbi:hypothetical protein [Bermanella sp. R86510]|uniref:hypothetical protein n=1 Tax=unclassified Bermanella TaxID=2627862 RepID=UPI0037C768DB